MVISVGLVEGFAWVSIVVVSSAPTASLLDLGFLPPAMGLYRWQKIYHDARRKYLEFKEGDHVFLRVDIVTGVGCALKSKKLAPKFVGPYQISQRIGVVAYRMALPPDLLNSHDVLHVSQLRKYIHDLSHVIRMDDVQVRDNLMVEALPVRIKDRKLKKLRGKEIALVKIV
ncbi:uncharacterized protein LOC127095597 [Lathyrus oleraceus]|uniref:uncharacterized protein LOC127095597 n=1 Tax=Pisum sativum TaxID=3888 RepID=UPI0021CE321D|nr:uncharacterized protein LOC127095597 [Pisum sativum]